MENQKNKEKTLLKDVLGSFMGAYAGRDRSMDFAAWLEARLRQEMPEMSTEAGQKLADEIIDAVTAYDKALNELNMAVDAGQSREEWFAGRLAETYAGMPLGTVGEKFQQIEDTFLTSNTQLMHEIGCEQTDGINGADADTTEWNEYSIKKKAYEIGEQISFTGEAVTANVLKEKVKSNAVIDMGNIVGETIPGNLKNNSREIKAVVAGAVRTAAEKGAGTLFPQILL